jgi:hypothetical protein
LTVVLLFVLTIGAFGISQRLKREPLVIDRVTYRAIGASENDPKRTVFSPNGDCRRDLMVIRFRTTKSDRADVEIIGPAGGPVRMLAEDRFFKRYREHKLIWDGRKDNGNVPETNGFRVRVTMRGLERVLYLPGRIRLHSFPAKDSACEPGKAEPGARAAGQKPGQAGTSAAQDQTGPAEQDQTWPAEQDQTGPTEQDQTGTGG